MRPTGSHDLADLLDQLGTALEVLDLGVVLGVGPGGGHVDLHERRGAGVDGAMVHVDDVLALLQRRTSWRRPSCSCSASSAGRILASVKKADCRMVLVRLPMPISTARSMALMV